MTLSKETRDGMLQQLAGVTDENRHDYTRSLDTLPAISPSLVPEVEAPSPDVIAALIRRLDEATGTTRAAAVDAIAIALELGAPRADAVPAILRVHDTSTGLVRDIAARALAIAGYE